MAVFSYTGLNERGQEIKGEIDSENEKIAVRQLREQGIFVLKVEPQKLDLRELAALILSYLKLTRYLPVGTDDLVMLFRQTALMLRSGYTLVTTLEANIHMVSKFRLERALRRMEDGIRRGETFSSQLAKEKGIFSPVVANLVASGEQSGSIESILERLADSMERTKDLKRQVMAAMFYPGFVLLVTIGVVIFLVMGVIPRFEKFLSAKGADIPASTQLLLDISDFALTYAAPGGIVGGALLFAILAAYTTKPGKRVIDRVLLAIPVLGKAILFGAMAQLCWTLSMLLASGVTVIESLRIGSRVVSNGALSACIAASAEQLLDGVSLSKSFEQRLLPTLVRHMAAVGENSGELETVMHGLGVYYQRELSSKVKLIAVAIEPMLILCVGGMVFFVYYAFFKAVLAVSTGGM